MRLFKYVLPIVLAAGFTTTVAHADIDQDGSRYDVELDQRDFDALRDFVNSKRTIDVKEKSTNLTISGDVRAQWRHFTEKAGSRNLRGREAKECLGGCSDDSSSDSSTASSSSSSSSADLSSDNNCWPISRNDFNAEFNLRFDYVCDRAWAVAHLNFDDAMGVDSFGRGCHIDPYAIYGSGEGDDLLLKKAYFGYNLCADGCSRFDIEVGRRGNLYNVFDSKIQFLSRFDGVLLKYSSTWECVADWYVNLAGFVIDERVNHFGWVTEIGFLNICDSGFDLKYSFIDWRKNGRNRCWEHNPRGASFQNSQFTFAYHFDPDYLCAPAKLYGAFLWNHVGRTPDFQRAGNSARGYDNSAGNNSSDGATSSQVAQGSSRSSSSSSSSSSSGSGSSSSSSSSSEGRHNKHKNFGGYIGFYVGEVVREGDWAFDIRYEIVEPNAIPDGDVSGIGRGNVLNESYTLDGRGNTNYRGWLFEGLYALTDNLTIDTILEFSRQDDKKIGGSHHYSKFEIEAIYAF